MASSFTKMTRSDGKHHVTVLIKHHISGNDVARIITYHLVTVGDETDVTTRTDVEQIVRDFLYYQGTDVINYLHEKVEPDDWSASWAKACEVIKQMWAVWGNEIDDAG